MLRLKFLKKVNSIIVKFVIVLIGLFMSLCTLAQQEPMYTQYMFNTQVINPAYAGSWDNLGFLVLGRRQWVGLPGAPQTLTFSAQSPAYNNKVGIGLNLISDKIGLENRLSLFGDYSYRLRVTDEMYIRLGLKFGFTNYSHNLAAHTLYPGDPYDPSFMSQVEEKFMPNFGIGSYLYGENYYIGMSIPKLVHSKLTNNYSNYSTVAEWRHLYLTAGYVFDLSSFLRLKPTVLAKIAENSPAEFDLSVNFLLKDKFWLGAMYRTEDAICFIGQWVFENNTRIGYAIDFTTSKLQNYHNGTHEVMVSYELGTFRRKWNSPRMF